MGGLGNPEPGTKSNSNRIVDEESVQTSDTEEKPGPGSTCARWLAVLVGFVLGEHTSQRPGGEMRILPHACLRVPRVQ